MAKPTKKAKEIVLANAPPTPGLIFRRFRGERDFKEMASVITRSRAADGVDIVTTVQDLQAAYENPQDFSPESDILIAEVNGVMIGLARIWHERRKNKMVHGHSVELAPEWRGKGIREYLFEYNENQIRATARKQSGPLPTFFELWASDGDNEWKSVVSGRGYQPVQHEIDMIRRLNEIPEVPLPKGLEIRPVTSEHLRRIWEANREGEQLDWNYSEGRWSDAGFEKFLKSSEFQPELWQVAWDGETLAGMVLNYVLEDENRELNKKRGHTEHVFVGEKYRGKGLARALLAKSFKVLKERGMDEAMLGAEVENPHGALRLYEGMGFRIVKHFTWYQKPVQQQNENVG